jgi:outer membrane protein TolC
MSYAYLFRILSVAGLGVVAAVPQNAAEVRRLTLQEAVHLAISQNHELKIARLKVVENEQKKAGARAGYFPEIKNQTNFLHTNALENIDIPAGAFGSVANGGVVPSRDVLIGQGSQTFVTSGTGLTQPLTQLIRIRQANRIAASEVAASRDEVKKAENEVAVRVHELYYGILVTRLQKRAADQETAYAETNLHESEEDIRNGNALKISALDGRAGLLQSQQTSLTAELQLSDLTTQLNDLLGLPLDTPLELSPVQTVSLEEHPRDEYLRIAFSENPQMQAANESVEQAKAGVTSARSAYIPDVSAIARQSYQNGVPFLVHNFGTFGVNLSYDVFDFGKRRAAVRERDAQLAQAQENLTRLKEAVSVQIERGYNKVERTKHMLRVATEVVQLREEGERLAENQVAQGLVLVSARRQASAASYKAQADLLQAQLAYQLAGAELEQAAGRTPGL